MVEYLGTAILKGGRSHMPGIPNRDLKGDFFDDGPAVLFCAKHGSFGLAIPYDQIKECYAASRFTDGLASFVADLVTFGMWPTDDWLVYLTWYSADHDMDMSLAFLIGNSAAGPLTMEKRAVTLAKTIWAIRSERLAALRKAMTVRYR